MCYYVYIIRTEKNELYIGQTNNLNERIVRHKHGRGARFIKEKGSFFDVVYFEEYLTRVEAMRRERQLKKWSRLKKEALIDGDIQLLKGL